MYNYFMLIGTATAYEEGKLTMKVNREFKNAQGVFDTDVFEIDTWEINFKGRTFLGEIISVKGRMMPASNNGGSVRLVAERIMFSTTREGED